MKLKVTSKHRSHASALALCMLALLSGCASVTQQSTTFTALSAQQQAAPVTLGKAAELVFDTGYQRQLAAGSRWQRIGTIAQGDVYKPLQDVLTIEGAHIHEAYLVLAQQTVVGFYLPAERTFSPLKAQLALQLQ